MKNFATSGKKGDLIMSLQIVQSMGGGNVYLKEGEFEEPLPSVLESCGALVTSQPYVQTFAVWQGEPIDVDLDLFRTHPLLFRATLLEVMRRAQGLDMPATIGPWIDVPPDERFRDQVVIHRRTVSCRDRENPLFDWDRLIALCGAGNVVFVSRLESEWKDFGRPKVAYHKPVDNYEHARILKGCRLYIGNQSMPSALADTLGVPRIFELSIGVDRCHFAIRYADNVWFFASPWRSTLKQFRYLKAAEGDIDLQTGRPCNGTPREVYPFRWTQALALEAQYQWNLRRALLKRRIKRIVQH